MMVLLAATAAGSVGSSVGFVLASLWAERARSEAEVDRDLAHRDAVEAQDALRLLVLENMRLRGEVPMTAALIPTPWPKDRTVDVQRVAPVSGVAVPGPWVAQ